MKLALSINELIKSAREFCEIERGENHVELIGVTDGKAVGTYVEHKFQTFLLIHYATDSMYEEFKSLLETRQVSFNW